jgi:hypothetical protein
MMQNISAISDCADWTYEFSQEKHNQDGQGHSFFKDKVAKINCGSVESGQYLIDSLFRENNRDSLVKICHGCFTIELYKTIEVR